MKIAFDAKRVFNNSTGLGNYGRSLLRNLYQYYPANEYSLFTPKINQKLDIAFFEEQFDIVEADTFFKPLWRSFLMSNDVKKTQADVFHGLSNEIPRGLGNIKKIVTIHDLIFKKLPDTYPFLDRMIYDKKSKFACKQSDVIIAISEHTKQDIIDYYGIDENKIKVIYQSVDPIYYEENHLDIQRIKDKFNLPQEYIFTVGTLEERKNQLSILKALSAMSVEDRMPLVILGKGKIYKEKLLNYIQKNELEKWIIFINDYVSLAELKCIYEDASLLVYPSFYEGFGLPIVEALLSKTPVITGDISSMPEAAGDDSVLIYPHDIESIKDAILRVLGDSTLQDKMIVKGYKYALEHFHPKVVTKKLIEVYDD
jgi:glycosyltransferase involved in cell wall biosynthesis